MRALRGHRSQTAFARRLGYQSNAVYTWESGRRSPTASTFLAAAAKVGVDVPSALQRFYRDAPAPDLDLASAAGVAALLTDLKGDQPLAEVAARAERSRFAVSRWLKGQAEPRLPDLLRMVEATSLRLLDFVALFADPTELPSTRKAWDRLEAARQLARSSPWANVVLLGLELAPYRERPAHDDLLLAEKLGLPTAQVRDAIRLLEKAGQIRRLGQHYVPVEVQAVDLRGARPDSSLKRFWAEVAVERMPAGMSSYNVFTISSADLQRLEEMQRAHYRAIRAVIADSSPAEHVVLVSMHLAALDQDSTPPSATTGRSPNR